MRVSPTHLVRVSPTLLVDVGPTLLVDVSTTLLVDVRPTLNALDCFKRSNAIEMGDRHNKVCFLPWNCTYSVQSHRRQDMTSCHVTAPPSSGSKLILDSSVV